MRQTEFLQEVRMKRFMELYDRWQKRRLTQSEAAHVLGVHERTFRRYIRRYEKEGVDGLYDKRISQASHRCAPVDEVMRMAEQYRTRHCGWNVRHFYSFYKRDGGSRSYTWVKNHLQQKGLVKKAKGRGKHRKSRERSPLEGMMIHQDGSTHQWVPDVYWDLIVTMDDATNEQYSMFFVEEEDTASSFKGVREVIEQKGLFSSFYTDRGSHYWNTPKAGGKVDKINLTQFGRALRQLGIEHIPAYSPQARGRSERMFGTHQGRLPNELALYGITDIKAANRYLREVYMPAFNAEFACPAPEKGSAFVSCASLDLRNILCEQHSRVVGNDNCVSFKGFKLQIPSDPMRYHYVRVKVRVHVYPNEELGVFHGPRMLGYYDSTGQLFDPKPKAAA